MSKMRTLETVVRKARCKRVRNVGIRQMMGILLVQGKVEGWRNEGLLREDGYTSFMMQDHK